MTFEEAKNKKELLPKTIEENGVIFGIYIVPSKNNDADGYKNFISHYAHRNKITNDETAKIYSTKNDFEVFALRLDGSLVFHKNL